MYRKYKHLQNILNKNIFVFKTQELHEYDTWFHLRNITLIGKAFVFVLKKETFADRLYKNGTIADKV